MLFLGVDGLKIEQERQDAYEEITKLFAQQEAARSGS